VLNKEMSATKATNKHPILALLLDLRSIKDSW
jgi:hypothetical protein